MREIGERLDSVALSGFMYCMHCRWADGDCLQFNEDLPQPTVWSRRSASRGCSLQTGSRLCILLHLETEMKRDGGSVSTQRKVKSTHCPCEVHLIHSVCSHESVVEIPFPGIFFPFLSKGLKVKCCQSILYFYLLFHNVGVRNSSETIIDGF